MSLINKALGVPVDLFIGRAGEKQDQIPGRIVGPVQRTVINGRPSHVADVVIAKTTLAGEEILQLRELQNLYWTFDRTERCEALDGTAEDPKSVTTLIGEAAAMLKAFVMNGGGRVAQSVALEDLPE